MAPPPLAIEAVVHPAEKPILVAATRHLADCLSAASGSPWSVALGFADSISVKQRQAILVTSLLLEMPGRGEPLSETERRWRDQISALGEAEALAAFVCTIFRYVAGRPDAAVVERIRRLNLMAAELSHDTGINVIDLDRALTFVGARKLHTDYRLGGPAVPTVAGHVIVSGILGAGLDDFFPPEIQERAKAAQRRMVEGPRATVSP